MPGYRVRFLRFSVFFPLFKNRIALLPFFAMFLVWSLDRVAQLCYLMPEFENAKLLTIPSFIHLMLQKRNNVF